MQINSIGISRSTSPSFGSSADKIAKINQHVVKIDDLGKMGPSNFESFFTLRDGTKIYSLTDALEKVAHITSLNEKLDVKI